MRCSPWPSGGSSHTIARAGCIRLRTAAAPRLRPYLMMPRLGLHPNNNRDAGGGGDGRPRPFGALHESVSGHQTFRSDAELRTLFEVERTFSWGARVPTATLTAKICCDAQQTLPPNVITSARPGSDRRGKPHEAARVHHTSRRRGGGVPARGAGAAGRAHAADRCADELCGGRSRYQTTSHLASRAISQKFIACLSNTLVVAPRKTPQLSPASNNGLALIGEKIRRGISRHGANTSRGREHECCAKRAVDRASFLPRANSNA